jgi:hypothetical protein
VIDQISLPHPPVKGRISITTLIDAPRIYTLQLEHWDEISVDYSEFLETIIGLNVHKSQEKLSTDDLDIEAEVKFEDTVDGITIVGKADNYEVSTGIIRDTKTKATGFLKYKEAIDTFTTQLNCYAWQRRRRGFVVNGLEIDIYYRDWKNQEYERDKEQWAVMKHGNFKAVKLFDNQDEALKHTVGKAGTYVEHRKSSGYPSICVDHSFPIKLWSFEEQEQYIKDQIEYFVLGPMECDKRWKNNLRCKAYCKVRTVCSDSPCFIT